MNYHEVIANLRFRIAAATEELTLLDVAHSQLATRRVELQTNIAGMNELAEDGSRFVEDEDDTVYHPIPNLPPGIPMP